MKHNDFQISSEWHVFMPPSPGLGRIGKVHLKNVLANPRLEPRWLVDLEQEYVDTVREEFHIPRDTCNITTFEDISPALRDER